MVNNSEYTRVLMILPFSKVQRGNTLTGHRIKTGLESMGFSVDITSPQDENFDKRLHYIREGGFYSLVHGFHAMYFGQILTNFPELTALPLILNLTGTDINIHMRNDDISTITVALDAADALIIFQQQFQEQLITQFPRLKDKIHIIPQGVVLNKSPVENSRIPGITDNDIVIILPSGLRPVKNIELALNAFESARKSGKSLKLLILGAQIDKTYTEKILTRIKNMDGVYYLGEIPHGQIENILEKADIVLNTSISEGQPQAALEAMSLGIPAIMTPVPGNLNVITNGVHGFYAADTRELAAAILSLAEDPTLRHRMGEAAKRLVNSKYTVETEIHAYLQLYSQLLLSDDPEKKISAFPR